MYAYALAHVCMCAHKCVCTYLYVSACVCVCTLSLAVFAHGLDLGSPSFRSGKPVQFAFLFCSEILLIKRGGSGADKLGAVSN